MWGSRSPGSVGLKVFLQVVVVCIVRCDYRSCWAAGVSPGSVALHVYLQVVCDCKFVFSVYSVCVSAGVYLGSVGRAQTEHYASIKDSGFARTQSCVCMRPPEPVLVPAGERQFRERAERDSWSLVGWLCSNRLKLILLLCKVDVPWLCLGHTYGTAGVAPDILGLCASQSSLGLLA